MLNISVSTLITIIWGRLAVPEWSFSSSHLTPPRCSLSPISGRKGNCQGHLFPFSFIFCWSSGEPFLPARLPLRFRGKTSTRPQDEGSAVHSWVFIYLQRLSVSWDALDPWNLPGGWCVCQQPGSQEKEGGNRLWGEKDYKIWIELWDYCFCPSTGGPAGCCWDQGKPKNLGSFQEKMPGVDCCPGSSTPNY